MKTRKKSVVEKLDKTEILKLPSIYYGERGKISTISKSWIRDVKKNLSSVSIKIIIKCLCVCVCFYVWM